MFRIKIFVGKIYFLTFRKMAVLDLNKNAPISENWTWKISIALDYDWKVYNSWTWLVTDKEKIEDIEASYNFGDLWYFQDFQFSIWQWDTKTIDTDYCWVGEILAQVQDTVSFSFVTQEILEMQNLALVLWEKLYTDTTTGEEVIVKKVEMVSKPYLLIKFETCPDDEDKVNTFYFVKSRLSWELSIAYQNMARWDFTWTTMSFEVAKGWNLIIDKWNTPVVQP